MLDFWSVCQPFWFEREQTTQIFILGWLGHFNGSIGESPGMCVNVFVHRFLWSAFGIKEQLQNNNSHLDPQPYLYFTSNIPKSLFKQGSLYDTNPNNTLLFSGNPSKLPPICIVWFPLKMGSLMSPVKFPPCFPSFEQWKMGPWLVRLYRGWDPTQLNRGYNKPWHKDPFLKQPGFNGKWVGYNPNIPYIYM